MVDGFCDVGTIKVDVVPDLFVENEEKELYIHVKDVFIGNLKESSRNFYSIIGGRTFHYNVFKEIRFVVRVIKSKIREVNSVIGQVIA